MRGGLSDALAVTVSVHRDSADLDRGYAACDLTQSPSSPDHVWSVEETLGLPG